MAPASDLTTWPPHERETRAWQQANRGGTRDDRMLRQITVSLPPLIAGRDIAFSSALSTDLESAMQEITSLDADGTRLQALSLLLLRTESVASSKIEAIEANLDDYARALHGIRSNASAVSMAAATTALDTMIGQITHGGRIELTALTGAHAVLMRDDPAEAGYAGQLRDMQNWIGGSDHSPRTALYVPPPPDTVQMYMDDLISFTNRDDLPALVQAALAHAQFESIHPFTDGNGRIGRALINTVLRRRGATTRIVVPLASALVAHREQYFDILNAYRRGQVGPLLTSFAQSSRIAATESRTTAARLSEIPCEWQELVGPSRRHSAVTKLLGVLFDHTDPHGRRRRNPPRRPPQQRLHSNQPPP